MTNNELAIAKKDVVDVVENKVQDFLKRGELQLPPDYSPHNAMKSAWLTLQEVETSDRKPALSVCSKNSIANALLDMVVQGLNPSKNQCYFIPYGKKLICQRSYFGTMAVAKLVDPTIEEIVAEVVYEGDTLKYKIERGKKIIAEHLQEIENIDSKNIKAAYCIVIDTNGEVKKTEIMTMDEIKKSWGMSKMKPLDDKGNVKASSTHGKFMADMCKRTVINKTVKPIINSSSDSHLLLEHFNRADEERAEEDIAQEIDENANSVTIDIDSIDVSTEDDSEIEEEEEEEEAEEAPAESKPKQQSIENEEDFNFND